MYIPGCPPRPEALIAGILQLKKLILEKKTQGSMAPAVSVDFQASRPAVYKAALSRAEFRKSAPAAEAPAAKPAA